MGSLFTKLKELFSPETEKRLVMLGIDCAGKSSLLYRMKLGEVVQTTATIGLNVETLKFSGLTATAWDIGGQTLIRPLWKNFLQNIDGIIYVVDSCDTDRMELASEELFWVLSHDDVVGVPLLVFANKQDRKEAITPGKVGAALKLDTVKNRDWFLQGSSAITGDGLVEGFTELSRMIKKKSK